MLCPLFAFFSFQTPFSCFLELFSFFLKPSVVFRPSWYNLVLCTRLMPSSWKMPGSTSSVSSSLVTEISPSLKRQMAKYTASFTMASPTLSSLGLRPQMTPWRDSFWFWVFPVLHLANSAGSLSLWNMGFTASTIAAFKTFSLSGVA